MTWLPIDDMVAGHVYRIESRNLTYGVWNPDLVGFTGIRTKFGHRFLFTEDHWDTGPPHGTAKPYEDTGFVVPDGVDVSDQADNDALFRWLDDLASRMQ